MNPFHPALSDLMNKKRYPAKIRGSECVSRRIYKLEVFDGFGTWWLAKYNDFLVDVSDFSTFFSPSSVLMSYIRSVM